jgi:antitoxin (DNA-binding transcriptional repressor) of toxin-antitoxin stability system
MRILNMHEPKTHFPKWVDSVQHGEEIVIAKAEKPVGRHSAKKSKRRLGCLKGRIKIAEDFDAPLPDTILEDFDLVH